MYLNVTFIFLQVILTLELEKKLKDEFVILSPVLDLLPTQNNLQIQS